MPRPSRLLLLVLALAAIGVLGVRLFPGVRGAGGAGPGRAEPAAEGGPLLQGRAVAPRGTTTAEASEHEPSESEEPPPEVYTQPDGPPPAPPVALRLRFVLPWGPLRERPLGGATHAWGYTRVEWRLKPPEGPDRTEEPLEGLADTKGVAQLGSAALTQWMRWPLVITAQGCLPKELPAPPAPLPSVFEVVLEPDAPLIHFRGRVLGADGRGLAGAGVFVESWREPPGVPTGPDGSFDLMLVQDALDVEVGEEGAVVALVAVAPGHLVGRVYCPIFGKDGFGQDRFGKDGLSIPLAADTVNVRVEITFEGSDGIPAPGTRAWLFPADGSFQSTLGWQGGGVRPEPGPALETRRLLPRVVGGWSADDQGFFIAQDAGPYLLDLVADADGVLLLPAVRPGRYRLRAARADRTDADGSEPETGSLHVRETLETVLEVAPPPGATRSRLRFLPGRTVIGRIQVEGNAAWHCEHEDHSHRVGVEDWVWGEVAVASGARVKDGVSSRYTGRFRLDGVPRTACTLNVWTWGHPLVRIALPELVAPWSSNEDLGTIRVPDSRAIYLRLQHADGRDPDPAHWDWRVSVEGLPGVGEPSQSSDGRVTIIASAPPPSGALVVVRSRASGRELLRAPLSPATDYEAPLVIRVPDPPPEPTREAEPGSEPEEEPR